MLEQLNAEKLCDLFCAEVSLHKRGGFLMLKTPFTYPDGDGYPLYLSELPGGGVRVSDGGHTLMRLSCENGARKFFGGAGDALLERVAKESGVRHSEENGRFYIDSTVDDLPQSVFRLGQALTRVCGLT